MAEQQEISNTLPEQDWATKEKILLDKISCLELTHSKEVEDNLKSIQNLKNSLQIQNEEREKDKTTIESLQNELTDLKNKSPQTLSQAQQAQVDKVKLMSEEMLTKAKGIIFDKTKECKNQELQIEALNSQVTSLKEVVRITKDLLEIRNLEVQHLEDKMNVMGQKIAAERERRDLMDKKLDQMVRMNQDLKDEYQIQLRIFNALKSKYHENSESQNGGEN